jgi:hypothetical protein
MKFGMIFTPKFIVLSTKTAGNWNLWAPWAGLGGGILSVILGIILAITAWCLSLENSYQYLKEASIICFALNLPLFMLGAHCLDSLDTRPKLSKQKIKERMQ